jgi:hypothetical protein
MTSEAYILTRPTDPGELHGLLASRKSGDETSGRHLSSVSQDDGRKKAVRVKEQGQDDTVSKISYPHCNDTEPKTGSIPCKCTRQSWGPS